MKGAGGGAAAPGDYVYFKSVVPLHKISIGPKLWRYYDFGPKVVPPLVCIPGIAGTADVYYKQIMSLCMKGYRVISIDVPQVWNHHEWIHSFEKFLDSMNIHHVHIYGTSLGGFLAQIFAQHRPRRVKSLVLSNTFLETHKFAAAMPWSPVPLCPLTGGFPRITVTMLQDHARATVHALQCHARYGTEHPLRHSKKNMELKANSKFFSGVSGSGVFGVGRVWQGIRGADVNWTPSFLLKRYLLTGIRDGPHEPFIADSVDFIVGQVETLSRDDLSSRLMLNVNVASVGSLMLPDSLITIMDTNDYSAVPQQLKDQLYERYPGARRAVLKTGGDFPFLSRPDEVNLYLQLHLRRVGVEPRPDLVQGFTQNGSAGGSKDQREGGDSFGDSPGDNGHHGIGASDHDVQYCGSDLHDSDEPIPTSTMY
ncbi:unnamed protein product [Urochloa decumbens]|uniref:Maspardin n=1 Tax=Urochloa decumbens TaxID=240449 RepID=A0ABC8YC20_9POAL